MSVLTTLISLAIAYFHWLDLKNRSQPIGACTVIVLCLIQVVTELAGFKLISVITQVAILIIAGSLLVAKKKWLTKRRHG